VEGSTAVRHQSRGEPNFHPDPVRFAKLAAGGTRYLDRLGNDHLDDGGDLEALSLGGDGSSAILHLGIDCDRATTVDNLVELGDAPVIHFGLCDTVLDQPPKFRNATVKENDDVTFTPSDPLPICRGPGIPLAYDVHHHRRHEILGGN